MSGGGTLDRVLVSTTRSGWDIPTVAEQGEERGRGEEREREMGREFGVKEWERGKTEGRK